MWNPLIKDNYQSRQKTRKKKSQNSTELEKLIKNKKVKNIFYHDPDMTIYYNISRTNDLDSWQRNPEAPKNGKINKAKGNGVVSSITSCRSCPKCSSFHQWHPEPCEPLALQSTNSSTKLLFYFYFYLNI